MVGKSHGIVLNQGTPVQPFNRLDRIPIRKNFGRFTYLVLQYRWDSRLENMRQK